jgi:hypothetical protein
MDMVLPGFRVRNEKVRFHIVAFDFFEDLVRAVLVFILKIEDGIDEVFVLQKPEAILPAEAREHRAVVESSLAVQVELRGPPSGCAVFKLGPERVKAVADSLGAVCGEILDFEVAGLFEIVIIGDKVRALLGKGRRGKEKREYGKGE